MVEIPARKTRLCVAWVGRNCKSRLEGCYGELGPRATLLGPCAVRRNPGDPEIYKQLKFHSLNSRSWEVRD